MSNLCRLLTAQFPADPGLHATCSVLHSRALTSTPSSSRKYFDGRHPAVGDVPVLLRDGQRAIAAHRLDVEGIGSAPERRGAGALDSIRPVLYEAYSTANSVATPSSFARFGLAPARDPMARVHGLNCCS